MKSFNDIREKTLTPAELKKREEIAKAMERDNPRMDMGKKMAIATATAKRVAEAVDYEKLTQLARFGLVDKGNVQKLIAAFKKMEDGKILAPQQRELMLNVLTDLTGIITGDSQMFQKAKKAVKEGTLDEAVEHINILIEMTTAQKAKFDVLYKKMLGGSEHKAIRQKIMNPIKADDAFHAMVKRKAMSEEVESITELTAEEKRLVNTMYDKKGNLTAVGKKVMDHGKKNRFPHNTSASQGKMMSGKSTMYSEDTQIDEARPSQRHPLEGHPYHKKTNAELEYIGKDAHKAAQAMKSHNPSAEGKYLDQANDSATVRHFRKTSGTPDWYKKKYGHSMKEEAQIDEASKEGTIRIVDLSSVHSDNRMGATEKSGFQVQRMTKGKFVNQGKPYKSAKDAEKMRKGGQHSMQFEQLGEDTMDEAISGDQYYYVDPKGVVVAVGNKDSMRKMNMKQAKDGNKGGSFSQNRKKYKVGDKINESVKIDEISMTKMADYAPKAVKSRNDAKAATHSADSNRVANAKKVIAKRKAGADNYNKKMWGYGNVAPTKESVEQDSYEKTKQKTMKTFPNVKHFTKSGHPDWKKHGITNIPTKESIDAKNIDAALVTQRKRLKFDTIMAKQATQHKKEKMARADGAAYRGRTEDTQIDEMGAFMSSPLPTPMSMRKEPSMTKPLMLTKKMNTAATLIKKAGNTPVSPRTEAVSDDDFVHINKAGSFHNPKKDKIVGYSKAPKNQNSAPVIKQGANTAIRVSQAKKHGYTVEATYSDTGWQKPEVKKDQSGNVIKTKNVAKTLAKSGLRRTKDLEAAQKAKYLTFSKVKK
jgi:hypothetical protein